MTAKNEIREERNDVFSFWELVPTIENGQIIQVETKIEETTLIALQKTISDSEQQILDLTAKIELQNSKIELIENL
jgi:hypothetical protein|tara:strand:+ start:1033 stop:1260 length:228 start_codon:yes stop_codon:yes gene_type:complete